MTRLHTLGKRHAGEAVRVLLIAFGSALNTYAAHQHSTWLYVGGSLAFLIGVLLVVVARIDSETMIRLALQQPSTTTRDQLDELMRLPYWD